MDEVFDVILLEFIDVWDNHKIQKINEHISSFPQNLECLTAINCEVLEGIILNFLLGSSLRQLLLVFLIVIDISHTLILRKVMNTLHNLDILLDKFFSICADYEFMTFVI